MIAEDLIAWLNAQSLTGVSGQISQGYAPQRSSKPYIVVDLVRDRRQINTGGSGSDFNECQLWVHVHHTTQVKAGVITQEIEALLADGFRGDMGNRYIKTGLIEDIRQMPTNKQEGSQDVDPGYSLLVTLIYGAQAA